MILKYFEFIINNGFILFFTAILVIICFGLLLYWIQKWVLNINTNSFFIKMLKVFFNAAYFPIILYLVLKVLCYRNNYLFNYIEENVWVKIYSIYSISFVWLSWMFIARIMGNINKIFMNEDGNNKKMIFTFFFRILSFFAYSLMFVILLNKLGLTISSVVALLGGPAIIISFAARNVISNSIGGILLYFNKSFKVNDFVSILGTNFEGKVVSIGIRKTVLFTTKREYIDFPNSLFLSNPILNKSHIKNGCFDIDLFLNKNTCEYVNEIILSIKEYLIANKKLNIDLGYSVLCDRMKNADSYVINVKAFSKSSAELKIRQEKHEIIIALLEIIQEQEKRYSVLNGNAG